MSPKMCLLFLGSQAKEKFISFVFCSHVSVPLSVSV